MGVKKDAIKLLSIIYNELVVNKKNGINSLEISKELGWDNSRINLAFHYLYDKGLFNDKRVIKNNAGIFYLLQNALSDKAIDIIEDKNKFKFFFNVNLGPIQFGFKQA